MKIETILVEEMGFSAPLTVYIQENFEEIDSQRRRPMVIICPGGGYEFLSPREAEPVALRFLSLGFQAAVLSYSVESAHFPIALRQLARAVAVVRGNATKWHVDPQKVIPMGFSAGGHLAASLGTFWNHEVLADLNRELEIRPDGLILNYPVITSGRYAHESSFRNLLGEAFEEKRELVSLELQVTEAMPPTFLWHTVEDRWVPAKNSLLLADALFDAGVPFEFHLFNLGDHGLSLGSEQTAGPAEADLILEDVQGWPELACRWVQELKGMCAK